MRLLTALLVLIVAAPILGSEDVVLTGQVVAVEHGPAEKGDADVLQIRFRTRNEEQVRAHLCPEWFLESDLEENEEMTLHGRFDDEGGFRVREMVRNEVRLKLRNESYEPLWLRTRLQQRSHFYNPRTERPMRCKIAEIYVDEPSSMMEAQVRVENREQVRVRFAPEWYLRKHLRLGDELELRGSEVGSGDEAMVLVREMRNIRTRREVTLRNREGFPMWRERSRERERERLRRGRMEEEGGRRGQENSGRRGPR
jgi:hypothetical protein